MRRTKILSIGLGVFLLMGMGLADDVLADRKGGGKGGFPSTNAKSHEGKKSPASNPEPLSCVLLLAGGATLAALRRYKNKRSLKGLEKQRIG